MASSSSSSLWKFDVFLSFRGEDTRRSFVSFLYKELERKGIRTFKDDKDLERGRSISPELLQAIEQSRFAIVVMSQNYASSGWCLDELLKIMDCQEKGSLIVIPVFYQVEPSQVRRQTGKFAEYFNKHDERENPEKVKRWRNELTKLANISGEHSRNWEDDSKLIDKVTNDILDRLISTTSSDFSNLVGMDVHMKAMYGLLDLESNNEVRIVGIWGMGGVGKTTLAEYVYEKILRHFPTQCFLKNVKRIYQDHGPSRLQEEFLSKNLQGGTAMIRNSYVGSSVIRERFGHRRILLVVDDVDKIEQLDALAKDACWFGPGSRIIITTRDKHLLVANGVKHVYEVKCMMHREALELFSQFAFKEKQPFVGLERVSLRAIQLAGGLPLALKVFGSFLRGRPREDWESALHRLGTSLDRGILEILKISYDGLDEQEKSIFLHIACLFNGELVDRVTRLLKNGVQNVQNAKFGIKVLAEKSLVIISSGGYIIVHDLVIKMGRELLRQQSIDRPGKCKILWEPNEIHDVLMYNRGSKAIEGISLDMAEVDELFISKGAFKRMPNLKFLKIYTSKCGEVTKVHLPVDMNFIARKLRYLKWDGYPSKTLQFRADCLVDLDLQNTKLEKLWEGSPCLGNLKNIDLSGSPNLNEFPDLSKAPNLEKIIASKCISLTEIPSSIASLKKLTRFDLMACKGLKRLPKDMNLKSLETVNLNECSSLKMFPEFSRGITKLYLSWRTRRELPESIGHLSHLVELVIYNCKKLESLPDTIGDLVALKYLSLYDCQTLWKIPKTIWKLKSLEYFGLINGRNITEFPNLPENVTEVRLTGTAIKEIQSRTGDLYYIESSDVSRSKWLKCLPACIYKVKHLQCPNAFDCSSQEPEQICESTRPFEELGFEDTSVRRLHPLSSFCHLKDLWISRAEKLDGVHFCCPPLSNFPALERLDLINLNMLEIPDDLGELKNLQRLDFSGNSFEMVPSSIQQLTKLDTLSVNNCDNLHSLPELPLNIKNLLAHGCVALETISKVLKHTWQVLVLSNCFKLKGEIELMSKHMASMLWNKEFVACLPGSEVPSCFNHRNRGSFLTIRLPRGQFSNELVGFAACIVASIEGHRCVGNLRMRIRWTCQYLRGSYRVSVLNGENFPCGTLDELSRVMEVQSDHLFLFNGHLKWMDFEEAAFDKVVFEFYCADWDEDCLSHVEIKECGVRLHFTRDSEEAGEDYRLHCSPSSFADEQSELKANAQEATPGFLAEHNFEMPSWLSWTRGDCSRELWEQVEAENPANRKRNHQSRDNESMNNEEEIEEPSSKKGKSIVFP